MSSGVQGGIVADPVRSIGVTEITYYKWRGTFGGLKVDQMKRPKDVETYNPPFRKAAAECTMNMLILADAAW